MVDMMQVFRKRSPVTQVIIVYFVVLVILHLIVLELAVVATAVSVLSPRPVPKQQILGLVSCLTTNTCEVARTQMNVNGTQYWAVAISNENIEVTYLTDEKTFKVLLRGKYMTVLMEDAAKSGLLNRIVVHAEGESPVATNRGEGFLIDVINLWQDNYVNAMEAARKHVLPRSTAPPRLLNV